MRPVRRIRRGRRCVLRAAALAQLAVVAATGAEGQDPRGSIHFRRFSVDDGLPQSAVTGIAQDSLGYLWLATQDGLTRYDGYTFATFRHDPTDPGSLPTNDVTSVLVDGAGSLWVGSAMGVRRVPPAAVEGALDLSQSTELEGMAGRDAPVFERPASASPVSDANVLRTLVEDVTGRIWMSAIGETAYWDPEREMIVPARGAEPPLLPELPRAVVTAARRGPASGRARVSQWLRDRNGVYWIAWYDPWELVRYDPTTEEARRFAHDPRSAQSLGAGEIFALFEDRWGELWVGTGRGGLNRVVRGGIRFSHVGNVAGAARRLPSNYITGTAFAPDGALWVGTDEGLQRIEPDGTSGARLTAGQGERSLEAGYVRAVVATQSGPLFVGAGSTLHRVDPLTAGVERLPAPDGSRLLGGAVAVDEADDVWAVFLSPEEDAVVYRVDGRTGSYQARHVLAPAPDSGRGGLSVQSLHVRLGVVWAGTWERGLYRLDTATGERDHWSFDPGAPSSLPHNTVQVIARGPDDRLWVGTRGGGMAALDEGRGTFQRVGTAEGLANDVVYGIVVDDDGYLWISTNQGLSRYDPERQAFRSFDVSDGLQSNEFNRWAFAKAPDGELVFGGINGLTRFHPSTLEPNTLPPLVALQNVGVQNQAVARGRAAARLTTLRLAHHQNLLTFEYVGLHSTDPAEIRYSYRLEGVEDAWVDAGARRFVNYANLAPGAYTFRVRALTGAGVWSDRDSRLAVTILPPFWRTWWFVTLAVAAAAALLGGAHRYRLATALREERIRTRIARDLHDDVSATLSSVTYFAEAIKDDIRGLHRPRATRFLELIARSAGEAGDRIGDIIWAISPEHQSWTSLLARVRRYASDTLDSHGIDHRIDLPAEVDAKPLRPDRRKHLWLILKEMTANASRHSRCTRVHIALAAHGRQVRLVFEDDGIGFDATAPRDGNGVSNIFARARELEAELDLDTGAGLGTRWELRFRA